MSIICIHWSWNALTFRDFDDICEKVMLFGLVFNRFGNMNVWLSRTESNQTTNSIWFKLSWILSKNIKLHWIRESRFLGNPYNFPKFGNPEIFSNLGNPEIFSRPKFRIPRLKTLILPLSRRSAKVVVLGCNELGSGSSVIDPPGQRVLQGTG